MLIGKKYKIEADAMSVTLFKKGESKAGKVTWPTLGYFATVQNALEHLVDLEVSETELKDLTTVVKKQDELYKLIDSLKI